MATSPWTYQTAVVPAGTPPVVTASPWAYQSVAVPEPVQHPARVWDGTTWRIAKTVHWDGTGWGIAAPAPSWRTLLAAATPTNPQHIYLLGSSSEYGAGATGNTSPKPTTSYPGRLASLLGSRSTGIVLANHTTYDNPSYDPRWARSAGVTKQSMGLHRVGAWRIPAGEHVEFTALSDRWLVYTLTAGGTPTITIDGQPTTPTLQAGHHAGHRVQVVTSTLAAHTVRITGTDVDLWAIEGRRTDDRIHVHNASISGRSLGTAGYGGASHNDPTGGLYGLPVIDTILEQGPGVVLASLTSNEWTGGTILGTIESRLRAHVARIQSHGLTPYLYVQPQPSPSLQGGTVTYTALRAMTLTVGADMGVDVLDCWQTFAGTTSTDEATLHSQGVARGYFADGIHPNDVGAHLLASSVHAFLAEGQP